MKRGEGWLERPSVYSTEAQHEAEGFSIQRLSSTINTQVRKVTAEAGEDIWLCLFLEQPGR